MVLLWKLLELGGGSSFRCAKIQLHWLSIGVEGCASSVRKPDQRNSPWLILVHFNVGGDLHVVADHGIRVFAPEIEVRSVDGCRSFKAGDEASLHPFLR